MEDRTGTLWAIAAGSGVVSFLILLFPADYSFFGALLLAILILLLVALVLWILWDSDEDLEEEMVNPFRSKPDDSEAGSASAPGTATDAAASATGADDAVALLPDRTTPSAAPEAAEAPDQDLPPVDEFIAREELTEAEYDEFAGEEEAEEAHDDSGEPLDNRAEQEADVSPEIPDRIVTERTLRKGAPRPNAGHKSAQRGDPRTAPRKAAVKVPAGAAPTPPRPDDLKRIHGIGPRIEALLHDLGVTTFAEIAAWTDLDVERIETALAFPGRISREDWIGQARALAEEAGR